MNNRILSEEKLRNKKLLGIISESEYKIESKKLQTEGKYDFEVYHESLSEALGEVERFLAIKGYEANEGDLFQFGTGGISYGQTKSYSFELTINGEPAKNMLHVQIYRMDSGKYELNMYYDNPRSVKENLSEGQADGFEIKYNISTYDREGNYIGGVTLGEEGAYASEPQDLYGIEAFDKFVQRIPEEIARIKKYRTYHFNGNELQLVNYGTSGSEALYDDETGKWFNQSGQSLLSPKDSLDQYGGVDW